MRSPRRLAAVPSAPAGRRHALRRPRRRAVPGRAAARGCRRIAVVDDDAELPPPDRRPVERLQEILRVALPRPHGIVDVSDRRRGRPPQLAAGEVLLDLLLERRAELDTGLLEEADLHELRLGGVESDGSPRRSRVFAGCRPTALGIARRSAISTPVEFSPAIIARSIIRHDADASRLATTLEPRRARFRRRLRAWSRPRASGRR